MFFFFTSETIYKNCDCGVVITAKIVCSRKNDNRFRNEHKGQEFKNVPYADTLCGRS